VCDFRGPHIGLNLLVLYDLHVDQGVLDVFVVEDVLDVLYVFCVIIFQRNYYTKAAKYLNRHGTSPRVK